MGDIGSSGQESCMLLLSIESNLRGQPRTRCSSSALVRALSVHSGVANLQAASMPQA
jgi:hypothetical protein